MKLKPRPKFVMTETKKISNRDQKLFPTKTPKKFNQDQQIFIMTKTKKFPTKNKTKRI
jgi:hypothetical protein